MLTRAASDQIRSFPTMHHAGEVMQAEYVTARDLDQHGQQWAMTVIRGGHGDNRARYAQPVEMMTRNWGWLTLIEVAFQDGSSFRFLHSRDDFEDQRAYNQAVEFAKARTPDLKILSAMERIRAAKAAKREQKTA